MGNAKRLWAWCLVTMFVFLHASLPTAGQEAIAVNFASAEDLFSCLGVRSTSAVGVEAGATVELVACEEETAGQAQPAALVGWRLASKNTATGHWSITAADTFPHTGTSECALDSASAGLLATNSSIGVTCCDSGGAPSRPGCIGRSNYADAVLQCKVRGLRLCTRTELQGDATNSSSCGSDSQLVWTSDVCQAASAVELLGTRSRLCLGGSLSGEDSLGLRLGQPPRLIPCGDPPVAQWRFGAQQQLAEASGAKLCLQRKNLTSVVVAACAEGNEQAWLSLPTNTTAALAEFQPPLRAYGRYVVDARGIRLKLAGTNWVGAHMEQRVNGGLQWHRARDIARLMRRFGFTHVRLNYAVEMLWDTEPVRAELVAANPELVGKTPLQVFDACVQALVDEGLFVVIACHTSDYRWCCSLSDEQTLWYNSRWPEEKWLESLTRLAQRYRPLERVIGFDLRNEPRPDFPAGSSNPILVWWDPEASWGTCTSISAEIGEDLTLDLGRFSNRGICLEEHTANLRKASEQGAYAVWHGNPDALVFIEGVAAADLIQVIEQPLRFQQPCLHSRVVWSVHDYSWAWRWFDLADLLHNGDSSFAEIYQRLMAIYKSQEREAGMTWQGARDLRRKSWGFLVEDEVAPVWVGEFGTFSGVDTPYWDYFMRYAQELDLDWAYWPLDGYKYPPNTTLYDGGAYFDAGQQITASITDGATTDYVTDFYGLLVNGYQSARYPQKLQSLVDLARAKVGPGIDGTEPLAAPGQCIFDTELQPVTGTGPLPRGFGAYAKVDRSARCPLSQSTGRQLNGTASRGAIVGAADWATAAEIHHNRGEACTAQANAEASFQENQGEFYARLVGLAQNPNPIDSAFRSSSYEEVSRSLTAHFRGLALKASGLWIVCLVAMCSVYPAIHLCSRVALAAGIGGKTCFPGCHRLAGICNSKLVGALLHFVVLAGIFYCVARAAQGRTDVIVGASALVCSVVAMADEGLNGNAAERAVGFLGFLPALAIVDDVVGRFADGQVVSNVSAVLGRVQTLHAAYKDASDGLQSLQDALAQATLGCAFASATVPLLSSAQRRLESSYAKQLDALGQSVNAALGGFNLQGLQQELGSVLDSLRQISSLLVIGVASFHQGLSTVSMKAIKIFLLVVTLVSLTVLPMTLCGILTAMKLMCPRSEGPGCCARTNACTARGAWVLSFLYGCFALIIALALQLVVQQGSNFCVVLDGLRSDGIAPYVDGLGLSSSGDIVKAISVGVFSACFTKSGNGQIIDAISLYSCTGDGRLIDWPDSMRSRLDRPRLVFQQWCDQIRDEHVSVGLANTQEVAALLGWLEGLNASSNASADVRTASASACQSQDTDGGYWCPGIPPLMLPGMCDGVELEKRIAALGPGVGRLLEALDNAAFDVDSSFLAEVLLPLSNNIFDQLGRLLNGLDCTSFRDNFHDMVDASCVGVVGGLYKVCVVHFALAACAFFLALVQHALRRRLRGLRCLSAATVQPYEPKDIETPACNCQAKAHLEFDPNRPQSYAATDEGLAYAMDM